jgi:hypothetical protein
MSRLSANVAGSPMLQQMFRTVDHTIQNTIVKGSLVTFNYLYWVHDPYPLVIISDVLPGNRIRGINLHYLTFNYISNLLKLGSNPMFSYASIKADSYITSAFRSYKWQGIRTVKKLDSNFVLSAMGMVRSFDVAEIENIRRSLQEQITQQTNPTADQYIQPPMT